MRHLHAERASFRRLPFFEVDGAWVLMLASGCNRRKVKKRLTSYGCLGLRCTRCLVRLGSLTGCCFAASAHSCFARTSGRV